MYIAVFWGWGFHWTQLGVNLTFFEVCAIVLCLYVCFYTPSIPAGLGRIVGNFLQSFASSLIAR